MDNKFKKVSKEAEAFISKANPVKEDRDEWVNFTLRIRHKMIGEIEEALRDIDGLSKTGFILQAIREKLRSIE